LASPAPPQDWPARREGKNAMTVLTWSEDRVEQLKKLWESGLSASQIAAETRKCDAKCRDRQGATGSAFPAAPRARPRPPRASARRAPAQQMMRVSRPVSRGNTALAHAFEVEIEADPVAYDNGCR